MDIREMAVKEIKDFYGDSVSEDTVAQIMDEWKTDNIYDLIKIIPKVDSSIEFYQECIFDLASSVFNQVSIPKWIAYNSMPCMNDCEKVGDEYQVNLFYKSLRDKISQFDNESIPIKILINYIFSFFIDNYNEVIKQRDEFREIANSSIQSINDFTESIKGDMREKDNSSWFFDIMNRFHEITPKNMSGFVYIAKQINERGVYKIGRTKNITGREKAFKTANLYISMVAYNKSDNAARLEKKLHDLYANKNIAGEWFILEDSDIEHLIRQYGFTLAITD